MNTTNSPDIAGHLTEAKSVIILLSKNPDFASIASGLGLFLSLERAGKRVEIVCPSPMLVEMNQLIGVQKIKTKLSGQNLVISFDYVKDAIEKVSYNVDNGKFNLVVVPKAGQSPLDPASVKYSYSGMNGDSLVMVGTQNIDDVKELFTPDVNLDERQILALVATNDRSLASETAILISSLGINPDNDVANNLFRSLVTETKNFTRASAIDFETAAALTRFGATLPSAAAEEEKVSGESVVDYQEEKIKSSWLKPKIFSTRETT